MKKKKILFILSIVILLAVLIYYQNNMSEDNITSSTVKTTGSVIVETETEEEIEEPVIEEVIEEPIEEFPETLVTDVKCIEGREITFTLNNILNKNIETSKLTFYVAGRVIRNPDCGKKVINPKESVDCKLGFNLKFNKEIKFTIVYITKRESVNIDCGT